MMAEIMAIMIKKNCKPKWLKFKYLAKKSATFRYRMLKKIYKNTFNILIGMFFIVSLSPC